MSKDNQEKAGIALSLLGGLVAIGIAILVTKEAAYLWALILLAWGVTRVRASRSPLDTGAVMALLYVVLGGVILYVADGAYLWAMILISWFTDKIL